MSIFVKFENNPNYEKRLVIQNIGNLSDNSFIGLCDDNKMYFCRKDDSGKHEIVAEYLIDTPIRVLSDEIRNGEYISVETSEKEEEIIYDYLKDSFETSLKRILFDSSFGNKQIHGKIFLDCIKNYVPGIDTVVFCDWNFDGKIITFSYYEDELTPSSKEKIKYVECSFSRFSEEYLNYTRPDNLY